MKTRLMAILNCTPDSFFEKNRFDEVDLAIEKGIFMANEGADLIDIGGESTRPGATSVPLEEELRRVIPVIQALKKKVSIPLSIDTQKPEVFEKALDAGVTFLNDVSALSHPYMRKLIKESKVPCCIMHMQNNPQTMQHAPVYPKGVVQEIYDWFEKKIEMLLSEGIEEKQLILDPGIGFGKSVNDNIQIIRNLDRFQDFKLPLLIGLSRKSFMGKILAKPATQLLSTTLALNTISILAGTDIIRVHDVKEHREVIDLLNFYRST